MRTAAIFYNTYTRKRILKIASRRLQTMQSNHSTNLVFIQEKLSRKHTGRAPRHLRGGSRAAARSKMERFLIIVKKVLHLGCCSSPRSASASEASIANMMALSHYFELFSGYLRLLYLCKKKKKREIDTFN